MENQGKIEDQPVGKPPLSLRITEEMEKGCHERNLQGNIQFKELYAWGWYVNLP